VLPWLRVPRSQQHAAEVAEQLAEVHVEACSRSAVDHAVVVGQATAAASGAAGRPCRPTPASMALLHTPRIATSGALMMGVK